MDRQAASASIESTPSVRPRGWRERAHLSQMKHSPKLNPSVVVFAVVILTARGAFADKAGPTPTPTPPLKEAQSTSVNSSRSNVRNNLTIPTPTPRLPSPPLLTGNSSSGVGATNPSSATGGRVDATPLNNRQNISDRGATGQATDLTGTAQAKQEASVETGGTTKGSGVEGDARVNSELDNVKGPEIAGATDQRATPDKPTPTPPKAAGDARVNSELDNVKGPEISGAADQRDAPGKPTLTPLPKVEAVESVNNKTKSNVRNPSGLTAPTPTPKPTQPIPLLPGG